MSGATVSRNNAASPPLNTVGKVSPTLIYLVQCYSRHTGWPVGGLKSDVGADFPKNTWATIVKLKDLNTTVSHFPCALGGSVLQLNYRIGTNSPTNTR